MEHKQDRTVYFREDGKWVNQLNGPPWTSTLHLTRDEAVATARGHLMSDGGGDLTVLAPDGTIEFQQELLP
ncbi:MAG: DUF2188 domain-containing protein [Chlorobi bacterium]|nr:DUF2188 domain-containing protein [Chlorobiota bacterium]